MAGQWPQAGHQPGHRSPACWGGEGRGEEGSRLTALQKRDGKHNFYKVWFLNYYFSKMIYALLPLAAIYVKL